ncbi:MAG: SAM-dependent methyltransferase [Tannerellaceae bacterium]|nr:SAM-dependent methyltransferase [Tannerellaceae bacterium]
MNPKFSESKFIMLNGGNKDFCLQTISSVNDNTSYFADSWSTNTKNFVALDQNNVRVYNWYDNKTEKYPLKQVEENATKFYAYLSSRSYKTPSDAVPFIIDIFRELRNLTGEKDPEEALNLLFRLLISIDDDYINIDSEKWEIDNSVVAPSNFDYYVGRIRQAVNSIHPNLDLILRHVSGTLFQEAHKEILYFNRQSDLFGGFSNKLTTKNDTYSSVHYTPPYLARSIVENCLKQVDLQNKNNLKIFDPACGSSEFLIETLKQLKHLKYQGNVKIIGWDASKSAVCTSQFLLKYEQQTQWDNDTLTYEIRQVTDSLAERWDNDYDLIVMNPPFVSWELLKSKDKKEAILNTLGSSYERKRPNIVGAFFYKAAKSLNENGVIGCVLPYSLLTSGIYTKMRHEIKEELSINLVAKLGNYIFENALTDVSFFIGKKGKSIAPAKLIWSKNEKGVAQDVLLDLRRMEATNQPAIEKNDYSIYSSPDFPLNTEDWKIISLKSDPFKKNLNCFVAEKKLCPTEDIFTINQGALSGVKNIFKISCEKYTALPKNEQKFFRPVIANQSIKCGRLKTSEFIWFPYNENGIMLKNETALEAISFAREILIPHKEILVKREGIKEWWGLTRPRNWQFEKGMRLYSGRFGNSDSFAIDTTGNCIVEEGNAFIPVRKFDKDDYFFYLSVFSSNIFDVLLSIYTKQLAGGNWYDLGAKYTKNIPIPNVHLQDVKESDPYFRLVELGKELERGNSYVKHAIGDVVKTYYPNI